MVRTSLILSAPTVALLALASAWPISAQERDPAGKYSVRPVIEVEPGFTLDPRQRFTLEIGGIGREPLEIVDVELNGQPLPRGAWSTRLGRLSIAPNRDLAVGLDRITLRYAHRTDSRHKADDNPVEHTFSVNHQRRRIDVEFGERGELIVEGAARFVRGGYRSGQVDEFTGALPSAVEAGLNLVHDYHFESYDLARLGSRRFVEEARNYLRRARQLGLGVFLGLPRAAVRGYDEGALATIIAALSNEPSLWLWYVYDEPTESTMGVETASRIYGLLRRLDPGRPAIILANSLSATRRYHPFCDVLWYDRYPVTATSKDLISLAPIAASLQSAMQTVVGRKPVWPVLQVQDNRGSPSLRRRTVVLSMPDDRTHRPTVGEIRAQSHLAIAQNVMGLIYYWAPESWYSMKTDTPETWKGFSKVMHEIKALEPVLLSTERPPELQVRGGHDKVMMWTRQHHGQVYVGLVNAAGKARAELELHPPFEPASSRQVSGDGQSSINGERIRVQLGPAGVVVVALELP